MTQNWVCFINNLLVLNKSCFENSTSTYSKRMIRPTCIIWVYINKNITNQISNNKIHHQSLFLSNAQLKNIHTIYILNTKKNILWNILYKIQNLNIDIQHSKRWLFLNNRGLMFNFFITGIIYSWSNTM